MGVGTSGRRLRYARWLGCRCPGWDSGPGRVPGCWVPGRGHRYHLDCAPGREHHGGGDQGHADGHHDRRPPALLARAHVRHAQDRQRATRHRVGAITTAAFQCAGPFGWPKLTTRGLPWRLTLVSYDAGTGVSRGTLGHLKFVLMGPACTAVVNGTNGTAADGVVAVRYANATGKLKILPGGGNLHWWHVGGYAGLVGNGEPATLSAAFAVFPSADHHQPVMPSAGQEQTRPAEPRPSAEPGNVAGRDVGWLRAYDRGMRYAQRGGYTPAEQQRRERLRLEAAGRFAAGRRDRRDRAGPAGHGGVGAAVAAGLAGRRGRRRCGPGGRCRGSG